MKKFIQKGFTLVELMIVIVIIAILVAISLVSYDGAKNTAKQTVTLNAMDQYEQLLKSYKGANGYYPPTQTLGTDGSVLTNIGNAAGGYVCLGVNGPADPPFAATQCYSTSSPSLLTYENSTIDTALKTMSSTLETSIGKPVTSSDGTDSMRGVLYTSQRDTTGASRGAALIMAPLDGKTCGRGTLQAAGSVLPMAICLLSLK